MYAARLWLSGLLFVAIAGCGKEPPCVDDEGEEVPHCEVKFAGVPDPILYCAGDHWAAEDGCNSCGCDGSNPSENDQGFLVGEPACTTVTCE